MIYLASPHSHPDPAVRQRRFEDACAATAAILRAGRLVFSPIAHPHHLPVGEGRGWEFWRELDSWFIARCSFLWVLQLDGWRESVGVQAEIDLAAECDKPMQCFTLQQILNGEFIQCPDARALFQLGLPLPMEKTR